MDDIIFFIPFRILPSLLLLSVIHLLENLNIWEMFIFQMDEYTAQSLRIGFFLTRLYWWMMTAEFIFTLEADSRPMAISGTGFRVCL